MTRDIRRRLQKLESQVPRQPTKLEKETAQLGWFLRYAVAYYLGDPTPKESVRDAYVRALGYPSSMNFERPAKPTMQTLVRGCAWPTTNY